MGTFVNGVQQMSDPATQALLQAIINAQLHPAWHDQWWGKVIIGVASGVIGGMIVLILQRRIPRLQHAAETINGAPAEARAPEGEK